MGAIGTSLVAVLYRETKRSNMCLINTEAPCWSTTSVQPQFRQKTNKQKLRRPPNKVKTVVRFQLKMAYTSFLKVMLHGTILNDNF